MPAATTIATVAALAISAGATIHQTKQAEEQAEEAEFSARKQQLDQQAAANELKKKEQEEAKQAGQFQRARVAASGTAGSRRNTSIFTSPVGVPGNPLGSGKTAIGA